MLVNETADVQTIKNIGFSNSKVVIIACSADDISKWPFQQRQQNVSGRVATFLNWRPFRQGLISDVICPWHFPNANKPLYPTITFNIHWLQFHWPVFQNGFFCPATFIALVAASLYYVINGLCNVTNDANNLLSMS